MSSSDSRPHPAVWLVYLIFPFLGPIATGDRHQLWATTAAVAAFLPVYLLAIRRQGWSLAWALALITLLGLLLLPINVGGSTLLVYAAALSPRLGTPRRAYATIVLLLLLQLAAFPFQPMGLLYLVPSLAITALIGFLSVHQEQIELKNLELRRSRDEITRLAQIAERERIARDLHDLLGHSLSVIVLKSELAARLAARGDERAATEAREIESVARQALREVRAAVSGYRAAGLEAELGQITQACAAAGIQLECLLAGQTWQFPDSPTRPPVMPPLVEGVLAMTLRETITNILRHAKASHCRVELDVRGQGIELVVSDDGCGLRGDPGLGMAGIRERVAALGGEVRWESQTAHSPGTRVHVFLPLRGKVEYQALDPRSDAA